LSTVVVQHEKLKNLVVNKLVEANVNEQDANTVADVLVHADLRGVHSHGVLRTEHYVNRLNQGGMNPNPEITVNQTGKSIDQLF